MLIYKYMLLINMSKELLDKIAEKVKKYNDFLLDKSLRGLYSEYDNLTRYLQQRSYRLIALALIETGVHSCDLVTRIVDIVGKVEGDAKEIISLVIQYHSRLTDQVDKALRM